MGPGGLRWEGGGGGHLAHLCAESRRMRSWQVLGLDFCPA
jgi:hypothetical protein